MTDYPGVDPDGLTPGGLQIAGRVNANELAIRGLLLSASGGARIIAEVIDENQLVSGGGANIFDTFSDTDNKLTSFIVPAGDKVWFEYGFDVAWSTTAENKGLIQFEDANHGNFYSADFGILAANVDALCTGITKMFISDGLAYNVNPQIIPSQGLPGVLYGDFSATFLRAWTQSA